ncbi:hypothetical protein [Aeromonas sp. R2-2]|uniref:hypothetical protein n=1 Tax=Aeromonas sp. R2-2 TaxID=3138460 RepID=UPI0034A3ABEC
MDPLIIKFTKEQHEISDTKFYECCELILINLECNPVKLLGFEKYFDLCDEINSTLREIKKEPGFSSFFTFQESINIYDSYTGILPRISMYEYFLQFESDKLKYHEMCCDHHFMYVIVEFNKNAERQRILDRIVKELICVYQAFKIHSAFFCSIDNRDFASYHLRCNSISESFAGNKIEVKKLDVINVNDEHKVQPPSSELSIEDFVDYVNDSVEKIFYDNPLHAAKFILQDEREYKYLREEYVPLKAYILMNGYSDGVVKLGKEVEPWDAIISHDGLCEVIEITQALPDFEHLTRKELASKMFGVKGMSLLSRSRQQAALDYFPRYIINAINYKHQKRYDEPRVLLVCILFEFLQDDNELLDSALKYVKENTNIGNFKSIYLVIDGKICIKLH